MTDKSQDLGGSGGGCTTSSGTPVLAMAWFGGLGGSVGGWTSILSADSTWFQSLSSCNCWLWKSLSISRSIGKQPWIHR